MIVDFGEYGDDGAREYLGSKPKLSLMLAGKFLEKIPDAIRNDSAGRLQDEIAIEGFLFFTEATVDGLYQEINKHLGSMCERDVKRKTIVDCLDKNGDAISAQIKKIIEDATEKPKWTTTEVPGQDIRKWPTDWDRSRSWRWEINELRNKITHRSITNQNVRVDLPGGMETSLTIAKIHGSEVYLKTADGSVRELDIERKNAELITKDNPAKYFRDCFQKMERVVSDIQGLLDKVPPRGKP